MGESKDACHRTGGTSRSRAHDDALPSTRYAPETIGFPVVYPNPGSALGTHRSFLAFFVMMDGNRTQEHPIFPSRRCVRRGARSAN